MMHLAFHQIQSIGSKWLQNYSKCFQMTMAQHCPKWSQMIPNGQKLSTMFQHCPKWSNMVPLCLKWSQRIKNGPTIFNMVPNGTKLSKKSTINAIGWPL